LKKNWVAFGGARFDDSTGTKEGAQGVVEFAVYISSHLPFFIAGFNTYLDLLLQFQLEFDINFMF
jgi:hypothetical protein